MLTMVEPFLMPSFGDIVAIGVALISCGTVYGTLSTKISALQEDQKKNDSLSDRLVRVEEGVKHANETLGELKQMVMMGRANHNGR